MTGTGVKLSGSGTYKPATTYSSYDGQGNRIAVEEQNQANLSDIKGRHLAYAADGTLLKKMDGEQSKLRASGSNTGFSSKADAHHISSNGQYLGEISERRVGNTLVHEMTLKDQHFSSAPVGSSSLTQYQTQEGDSLKALARAFYGNGDYWYLIANSNGLTQSPDERLNAGLTLDIPARANTSNSHNSFKPLDMAKIIGDTTPDIPYVPPPPRSGCNALAMVVMIAVTVVASIATAGAALATAPGTIMSTGISALTGGLGLAGAAAAAAGGFVGSVAGQLAGKAMGVVDSFSLKNAFASGLTAGATAGMGSWMGVGGKAAGTFTEIVKEGATATLDIYGKMALAASSVGINVAANKLAGNPASFQWRNVVTSTATAGLLDYAGLSNQTSPFEKFSDSAGLISGTLQGIAGSAIGYGVGKGLYNEGSWNFRNVATDSFGNALGNSIVSKLSQPKGYQIGDEITVDGQKGYVAGVDKSGKPTSISHSADNLRVEREQYASWDRDEYAQNFLRNRGLDTASMLRSMERTDTGLNYRHSFDSAIAMNLNPVYGQPEPMRNRGFMGRQLDSFNQWRDGVFNTYQDIAIQSGGGFMTGLVAAVETPTRLGLGVAEGALGLGGLLFDSSVRQDAANGMSYLFNNYDTVVPGAFNRWMDQSWDRQLSDLFVLGGEGLLGGVTGKYTWQAGKYGVDASASFLKARFNSSLSLNGTEVSRFSGNNGSWGADFEFGTYIPETKHGAGVYQSPLGINGYMPTNATVYGNTLFDFSDAGFVSRNAAIREGYIQGTQNLMKVIDEMQAAGRSSEAIARRVVIQRNSQKMESRSLMTPAEVNWLETRNMESFYKHPVGPTPDQMFKEYGSWDKVIQKSLTKDPVINILLGISPGRH